MTILFWNTHNNPGINSYLSSIIKDYAIDIVVLAEYNADEQNLYRRIRLNQQTMHAYSSIGCDRIRIFGNYSRVEPAIQNKYYSMQIVEEKLVLCGVHLPSDLHGDKSEERYALAREIMYDIHKEEAKIGKAYTIIAGDLNDMPYARSCLNADAFHGLPIYDANSGKSRSVFQTEYKKYYNPMWNFFGDYPSPPGTYYRSESLLHAPMWHMLDQFIFSYDTVPLLKREKLKIITECSCGSLFNRFGHPNKRISDHFPIMCEIEY